MSLEAVQLRSTRFGPIAVPERFVGALGGAESTTMAVWFDVAVLEPASFDAVTWKRIVLPRSAVTSVYVCAVAPLMSPQFAPD